MAEPQKNKTAYLIFFVAILLIACALFLIQNRPQTPDKSVFSEKVGHVLLSQGDVRRQFSKEPGWQPLAVTSSLYTGDRIYAGPNSQSRYHLRGVEFEVQKPGYLKVFDASAGFQLESGVIASRMTSHQELHLGDEERPLIIKAQKDLKFRALRTTKGIEIQILEGVAYAKASGQLMSFQAPTSFLYDDRFRIVTFPQQNLVLTEPALNSRVYSQHGVQTRFSWFARKPATQYRIEIASKPDFSDARYFLSEATSVDLAVPFRNSKLYWRVVDNIGQKSKVTAFENFIVDAPLAFEPYDRQIFDALPLQPQVDIQFQVQEALGRPSEFEILIAQDPNFFNPLGVVKTDKGRVSLPLEPGQYYWKARSVFDQKVYSQWSSPRPFSINPGAQNTNSIQLAIIPNLDYPEALYGADDHSVQSHLHKTGFLRHFFSHLNQDGDAKIEVRLKDQESAIVSQGEWPKNYLSPGSYNYQYRKQKKGLIPSEWSSDHYLNVRLQAPRITSGAQPQMNNFPEGARAHLRWTPLLYAHQYQLQVQKLGSDQVQTLYSRQAQYDLPVKAGAVYSFRVRALNKAGQDISDFSHAQQFDGPPAERRLASRIGGLENYSQELGQLSYDKSKMRYYSRNEQQRYWAWFGSGMSFTQYAQSLADGTSFGYQELASSGFYLEAGYLDPLRWGAKAIYQNNPQQSLSSASFEALYQKSKLLDSGAALYYGLHSGLLMTSSRYYGLDSMDNAQEVSLGSYLLTVGSDLAYERGSWTYEALLRYQHPLSTGGVNVLSHLALNGSLGLSYQMTEKLRAGLFWYGQLIDRKLQTSLGVDDQSYFFSNMDLRLGFDF